MLLAAAAGQRSAKRCRLQEPAPPCSSAHRDVATTSGPAALRRRCAAAAMVIPRSWRLLRLGISAAEARASPSTPANSRLCCHPTTRQPSSAAPQALMWPSCGTAAAPVSLRTRNRCPSQLTAHCCGKLRFRGAAVGPLRCCSDVNAWRQQAPASLQPRSRVGRPLGGRAASVGRRAAKRSTLPRRPRGRAAISVRCC